MLASALRIASIAATAILVLSFAMFAIDESKAGSERLVADEAESAPSPEGERAREEAHGDARELIDDADDLLVKPFSGVVDSADVWVRRGVPTLLALLVWGLGLRLLAGYAPGRG